FIKYNLLNKCLDIKPFSVYSHCTLVRIKKVLKMTPTPRGLGEKGCSLSTWESNAPVFVFTDFSSLQRKERRGRSPSARVHQKSAIRLLGDEKMVICRQLARLPTCSIKIDLFVSEISSVSSCEESTTHFSISPYLTMTVNNKDTHNSLTHLF